MKIHERVLTAIQMKHRQRQVDEAVNRDFRKRPSRRKRLCEKRLRPTRLQISKYREEVLQYVLEEPRFKSTIRGKVQRGEIQSQR